MTTRELIAGPELDLLIAEKVFHLPEAQMGHLFYWYTPANCGYTAESGSQREPSDKLAAIWRARQPSRQLSGGMGWEEVPHYTTDIGAAWPIADKFQMIVWKCLGKWCAKIAEPAYEIDIDWVDCGPADAVSDRAPHAICLAALKAVEATT